MDFSLVASFERKDCVQMLRDSLIDSFPVVPALRAILGISLVLHPQFFRDDDVNDDDGTDFILTDSKERTEKIIDLYVKRRVEIVAPTEDLRVESLSQVKTSLRNVCYRRMSKINKIAQDFGLKKVFFGLTISSSSAEEAPFEAAGTRLSIFSDPMIIVTPPHLKIQIDPAIKTLSENILLEQLALDNKAKEFNIAHEIIHIAHNHALIAAVAYLAFSIFSTGVWIAGIGSGLSIGSFVCTYAAMYGIAVPFQLFYNTLRRSQENEADLEAMNYLKSNEGALAAHSALKKEGR